MEKRDQTITVTALMKSKTIINYNPELIMSRIIAFSSNYIIILLANLIKT